MIQQMQNARKELHSVLDAAPSASRRDLNSWPISETVGDLIEFFSAQWGHLNAFDDTDRWMRCLPTAPYEERVAELRHLHEKLLETSPPDWIAHALNNALETTLELAETFVKRGGNAWADEKLLARMHACQETLTEAKNELIEVERKLFGPVPPIPATTALDTVKQID